MFNLQLFSYRIVNNPYTINPVSKNYNTKVDINSLLNIVQGEVRISQSNKNKTYQNEVFDGLYVEDLDSIEYISLQLFSKEHRLDNIDLGFKEKWKDLGIHPRTKVVFELIFVANSNGNGMYASNSIYNCRFRIYPYAYNPISINNDFWIIEEGDPEIVLQYSTLLVKWAIEYKFMQ